MPTFEERRRCSSTWTPRPARRATRDEPDHDASGAASCAAIPAFDNVGAHVGRAVLVATRSSTSTPARSGSRIDAAADYDETVGAIAAVADGARPSRRGADLLEQVIRSVAALDDRATATRSGGDALDALTGADEPIVVRVYGEDSDVLRDKADEVQEGARGQSTVSSARAWSSRARSRRWRSRSTWPRPSSYGIKPGDVRRAAATLVRASRSAACSRSRRSSRWSSWASRSYATSLTGVAGPADRHARRAVRFGSATSPTCAWRRRRP